MRCYNKTSSSWTVQSSFTYSGRRGESAFVWLIVTLVEAFHEALEMRRVAYRRYHLSDE
jgi:hypothetical protein